MAPVTVDSGAITGGGSGNTGWSARSTFALNEPAEVNAVHNVFRSGVGSDASSTAIGTSFTAGSNYDLAAVLLYLFRVGTPTDNYFVEIHSDSSSKPSGTVLATSDVIVGTHIFTGLSHLVRFDFATPPSLTNSTKYWIVLRRSGANDAANHWQWWVNTTNPVSGGRSLFDGSAWSTEDGTHDYLYATLKTNIALYQVTQDASLHVHRSLDDGATWAELDSADAPAVNSSTKPFSADHHWEYRSQLCDDGVHPYLYIGYFSGTNTGRVKKFNVLTGQWGGDLGSADYSTDVDFNRNIRVTATAWEVALHYTSVADDADLEFVIYDGAMSAQTQVAALNSTEASCFADVTKDRTSTVDSGGTRFDTAWFYDVANDDFTVRTNFHTTLGTATDLDASAADVETEHASAVYDVFAVGSVDNVIAAFIDADGTLEERLCAVGVTSASITMDTQNQVSASTSYAGRSLASCEFDGDLYIFACTGSAIDVHRDEGATGTWTTETGWQTGLTNAVVSTPVPIPGVGVLVSYTDNGDAKVNLYSVSIPGTLTVTAATAAAAGEAVTLDAAAKLTVTEATAPAAGQAVILGASGRLAVTAATAPAAGEAVTLDAAAKLTVAAATAPAAGQNVALTGQGRLTVTAATASAQGEAVTLDAAALFTIGTATAPAQGEAVNLAAAAAASLEVDAASAPAQGENVNLTGAVAASLTVTPATAAAAGEDVTFDVAARLIVDAATAAAQGEAVILAAAAAASLEVDVATATAAADSELTGQGRLAVDDAEAPAAGEDVTFTAAALFTIDDAEAPAQGEDVSLSAGAVATLTVTPATATAAGEDVTLDATAVLTAGTATAAAQGEAVSLNVAVSLIVDAATADAAAQDVTLYGQARLVVGTALAPAEGENVTLFGGTAIPASLTVAPATASAAGEAVTLDAASVFAIDVATATAQGGNVTLDAAALLTITPAVADAAGETVGLIGQAILTVTPAEAMGEADGAFIAAAILVVIAADASAQAELVDLVGASADYLDWAPHFLGPRRSTSLALSGVGSDFTGPRRSNDFEMQD